VIEVAQRDDLERAARYGNAAFTDRCARAGLRASEEEREEDDNCRDA